MEIKNLVTAVLAVMKEVENIDKNLSVGTGYGSYKGVQDKDVKLAFNRAMVKNGLVMLPVDVQGNATIERWEETYNGNKKVKQSVLTEVHTKYLLAHTSGECVELAGYGHGVDSQDKSAGKATTYAMKYALLYSFVTPTGSIDDADKTHSEEIETPPKKAVKKQVKKPAKPTQPAKATNIPSEAEIDKAINIIRLLDTAKEMRELANSDGFKKYRVSERYNKEVKSIIATKEM